MAITINLLCTIVPKRKSALTRAPSNELIQNYIDSLVSTRPVATFLTMRSTPFEARSTRWVTQPDELRITSEFESKLPSMYEVPSGERLIKPFLKSISSTYAI